MAHDATSSAPSARSADLVGGLLALGLVAWCALAAGAGAGDAQPQVTLIVASGLVLALGRWVSEREPLAAYRLIAIGVAGAVVLTWPGMLRAGGPPLGYANANAALSATGAWAALTLADATPRPARVGWAVGVVGLVAATVATGSTAAGLCLAWSAVLLAASVLARRPVVVILGGAISVVFVALGTIAIARGANPAGLGGRAGVRQDLWAAAYDVAADHPVRGVGVGELMAHHPVSTDPDLRWAHHEYLQQAAETGLVGAALMVGIVGWAYARLALAARCAPRRAACGAAALTTVALHATVDHVLHEPAVVLTLAMLVGAATARPPRPGPGTRGSRRPPP